MGSQSDPFNECASGTSYHKAWIGGEQNDLIALGQQSASAQIFTVRDGKDYECGRDMKSNGDITALRYGKKRDLLDIYTDRGRPKFWRNTFRIEDGEDQEFQVGTNFVVRRYGNLGDLIAMYGVDENGNIFSHSYALRDGTVHELAILSENDFGVTYGKDDDVRARFCFTDNKWEFVGGYRNGQFPESCTATAIIAPDPAVTKEIDRNNFFEATGPYSGQSRP